MLYVGQCSCCLTAFLNERAARKIKKTFLNNVREQTQIMFGVALLLGVAVVKCTSVSI